MKERMRIALLSLAMLLTLLGASFSGNLYKEHFESLRYCDIPQTTGEWNISDGQANAPGHLAESTYVALNGASKKIQTVDRYAYIATSYGVEIVDLAPNPPALVGSLSIGDCVDIGVLGKYAYLLTTAGNDSLVKVDVSDPTSPSFAADVNVSNPSGLTLTNKYAYIVAGNSIYCYDISGTGITAVSNRPLSGTGVDVDAYGKYMVVVEKSNNRLEIVNASNPASMTLEGNCALSHIKLTEELHTGGASATGISVGSSYALIADSTSNLQAFFVGDTAAPAGTLWADIIFPETTYVGKTSGRTLLDVETIGNLAYFSMHMYGIMVADISNLTDMRVIDSFAVSGAPCGLDIDGNELFLAAGDEGVYAYTIQDSVLSSSWHTNGISEIIDVAASDSFVYAAVSNGSLGVRKLRRSDGTLLASYYTSSPVFGVYVYGDYVYAAATAVGVVKLTKDLSAVDTFTTTDVWGICADGQYVYVADKMDGLKVVASDDMTEVTTVSTATLGGDPHGVIVKNSLAYVALDTLVTILDVTNPANPTVFGHSPAGILPSGIAPVGDYLIAADNAGGAKSLYYFDNMIYTKKTDYEFHSTDVRDTCTGDNTEYNGVYWRCYQQKDADTDTTDYYLVLVSASADSDTLFIFRDEAEPEPGPGGEIAYYPFSDTFSELYWCGIHEDNLTSPDFDLIIDSIIIGDTLADFSRKWRVPIAVDGDGGGFVELELAGDSSATYGYDDGIDTLYTPTGVFDAYFIVDGMMLQKNHIGLFEKPKDIILKVEGDDATIRWNPGDLPDGNFSLAGVDMKEDSSLTATDGEELALIQEPLYNLFYQRRLSPGWNIASLVADGPDNSARNILGEGGIAFAYDPVGRRYIRADTLSPGEPEASLIPGSFFRYDPIARGYENIATLTSGEGYWVAAESECDMTIDYTMQTGMKKRLIKTPDWYVTMRAGDNTLDFGCGRGATTGYDYLFDILLPPALPGEGQAAIVEDVPITPEFKRSIHPRNKLSWEITLSEDRVVVFDTKQLPSNLALYIDGNGNRSRIESNREFALSAGRYKIFAKQSNLPKRLYLDPAFPNPFNASVKLTFGLPEEGKVELAIYNILGQKVKTLVDNTLPAGEYSILWDGKTAEEKTAPTGVYFYRITFEEKKVTRKMLLLR
ncbi:MAG: hypothetical protein B6D65_00355 [candidate division Zixibacteria bacterium 4484_93]|nr:MAG: hypothetical protein B6D65_00355 [candidate division Zixibacteria bacterium 4484_93]